MKVLVTGVTGQLGHDVAAELSRRGVAYKGVGSKDMDLTDEAAIRRVVSSYRPEAIIHCAAYTAVDKAEEEHELCRKVNVDGTLALAQAAEEIGAKMVYISTDYVFDGRGNLPFAVDDEKVPCNMYGVSKLFGEQAVLVVSDQWGSPTYTKDLAPLLCDMIETEKYGIYHATNEGVTNWAAFAMEIFKDAGLSCKVRPINSEDYPTKATRPKNSRLSKKSLDAAGFSRLPTWQDALGRYLKEIGN